jgi:hypothetical protein
MKLLPIHLFLVSQLVLTLAGVTIFTSASSKIAGVALALLRNWVVQLFRHARIIIYCIFVALGMPEVKQELSSKYT